MRNKRLGVKTLIKLHNTTQMLGGRSGLGGGSVHGQDKLGDVGGANWNELSEGERRDVKDSLTA